MGEGHEDAAKESLSEPVGATCPRRHEHEAPAMRASRPRTALVVHESMFDNTATVAEAVARGLELEGLTVTSVDVSDAPGLDSVDADLLVVGAPTHGYSLSRPGSRKEAVFRGAEADRARTGVREWLEGAATPSGTSTRLVAMFDTRLRKSRLMPMSAGTRGDHLLHEHGFTHLLPPEGFLLEGVEGPLKKGEIVRAVGWGREVARLCQDHFAVADLEQKPEED